MPLAPTDRPGRLPTTSSAVVATTRHVAANLLTVRTVGVTLPPQRPKAGNSWLAQWGAGLMYRFRFQVIFTAAALTLLAVVGPAVRAAPAPSVSGGGVVSGPLGTRSQLGITVSGAGGHLL